MTSIIEQVRKDLADAATAYAFPGDDFIERARLLPSVR